MGLRRLVHSLAGIAHGKEHVRAGRGIRVHRAIPFAERDVRRLDRDPPTPRHRVPRIDDQIDDDLLQLAGVGVHERELRIELCHELNVLAQKPPEHLLEIAGERVEVEDVRLQHLTAAEREQLTR